MQHRTPKNIQFLPIIAILIKKSSGDANNQRFLIFDNEISFKQHIALKFRKI